MHKILTPKAVPVVLRRRQALEILVFRHPLAGTQIVKGTVESGESVEEAAARELAEEAGITDAECVADMGSLEQRSVGQVWHFRAMRAPHVLPERWTFETADDGGHRFAYRWIPLLETPPADCHPVFVEALQHLQRVASTFAVEGGTPP